MPRDADTEVVDAIDMELTQLPHLFDRDDQKYNGAYVKYSCRFCGVNQNRLDAGRWCTARTNAGKKPLTTSFGYGPA
jgi:hypothetical protein